MMNLVELVVVYVIQQYADDGMDAIYIESQPLIN